MGLELGVEVGEVGIAFAYLVFTKWKLQDDMVDGERFAAFGRGGGG